MKKLLALLVCLMLALSAVPALALEGDAELTGDLRILYPGTSDLEKEVALDMEETMKELYPNVSVEFMYLVWADIETKLAVMVQSGDYPDAMQIQDVVNPVAMGALEPIQSYIEASDSMKMDDFVQVALEANSVDDVLYAVPMSLIVYSHIVDNNVFADAGYDPAEIKDWTALKEALLKIGEGEGKYGYAMANGGEGRFTFRDFEMITLSNGFTPDDTSEETKPAYLEALQLIADLSPVMPESQSTWLYPELFKAWETGDVAMMHTGSYYTANAVAHGVNSMDFTSIMPMPAGPSNDSPVLMVGTNGYAMIAGSQYKDATWAFIEVAMSEPILGKLCGSLNAPAVTYLSDEVLAKYADIAYGSYGEGVGEKHIRLVKEFQTAASEYGVPMPAILGQVSMQKPIQEAIIKLNNGECSVEEAYEIIKTGIDEIKDSL